MLVEQRPCVLPSLVVLEWTLRSFVPSALEDDRQMGLFSELQIDSNATTEKMDFFWGGSAINTETLSLGFMQCSKNFLRDT